MEYVLLDNSAEEIGYHTMDNEFILEIPTNVRKHIDVQIDRKAHLVDILTDLIWHLESGEPFPEYLDK